MIDYFLDPVLRGPFLGSMLMCLGAALVGVIVLLRKQALIGESLSHAAYPGVILGVILAGLLELDPEAELAMTLLIMAGATATALFGLWTIHILEQKWKVRSDSALCFVLSAFFGIGLTLASQVQFSFTNHYRQVVVYLYGQAATMTDIHILVYGFLALLIAAIIGLFHKELLAITFDREFVKTMGIPTRTLDFLFFALVVLAVVVGIRSVGVVLMSAMLIAPGVAARQFTNHFTIMLLLAALFGVASAFFGNLLSLDLSRAFAFFYPNSKIAFPTGPMIVLVAFCFALFALLLAPERGLLWRWIRRTRFRRLCLRENILKAMWRYGIGKEVPLFFLQRCQDISPWAFNRLIHNLIASGWVEKGAPEHLKLTQDGALWAARVVRLHRLWEVYLVEYMGLGAERVHYSAEEMEHILTPELEDELTLLLDDPKRDPHHQPIPPRS